MSLASSYRLIAPFYDALVSLPLARARRGSLARLPRSGRLDVLFDGIGTGLDLPHVPACHRYVGTDLVAAMLARARARAGALECRLVQADAMRLPFPSACFDVVVLHLIVAIVPDPVAALAEAARVTRSGGTLLVWDKFLRHGERARLRRLLSPLAGQVATRLDVVLEEVLAQVPGIVVTGDRPAGAGGWFRHVELEKRSA